MRLRPVLVAILFVGLAACGGKENVNLGGDGGGGNGDGGGGTGADATPGGPCTASGPQCNNCIDDDQDGYIDGLDPECTGGNDNDESSFATGIPGDNKDAKKQDCFFDGNSGGSCQINTCCLFPDGQCPLSAAGFNRATDCAFAQACIDGCVPLTPPGCDCFGCCTICDGAGCVDVLTNPAVSPSCTQETIHDPASCPVCTKFDTCTGGTCDPTSPTCTLCPGQTPTDLDPACNGTNTCPSGKTSCGTSTDCGDNQYCEAGCCLGIVG